MFSLLTVSDQLSHLDYVIWQFTKVYLYILLLIKKFLLPTRK